MDTKQLRQKILDLAIRGKLVPQDPNDEPASVLLERVKAEKERLIAEGKIKRSKKSVTSSDKPHYADWDLPRGWEWCKVDDFAYVAAGSTPSKESFVNKGIPFIKMYNLRNQKIDFEFRPQYITEEVHNSKLMRSRTEVGDLIMNIVGPPLGKMAIMPSSLPQANFNQAAVLIRPLAHKEIIVKYLFYYLSQMSEINSIATRGSAGQVNISLTQSQNMRIALPPLNEQIRIVNEIELLWKYLDCIENGANILIETTDQIKRKVLELAISGKLVPQDPADEPAEELLRRINPSAVTADKSHYQHLPQGWCVCKLEDIVEYEQPQRYIVESTDYSDAYKTPVLTAGKSFVIGHTNESAGVFEKVPVIIFDDFTTDSKYVDFPFKVKSSAMKILHVKSGVNIKYVYYFMSITRLVGKTHKRYWISEYSKLDFPLPPYNEQCRIVDAIERINNRIDDIAEAL